MHLIVLILFVFYVQTDSGDDESPDVLTWQTTSLETCQAHGHELVAKAQTISGVLGATFRCEDIPQPNSI
jgi:hypothetical protein